MAPIRRYLRISKCTVLECRIYLENPSNTRWLLDSRDSVLPRVFTAIRPLVLPKLREENKRLLSRKKGKPDFEVALFLRESRTRHSLLTRHKDFETSASANLISGMGEGSASGILVESDSDLGLDMDVIPQARAVEGGSDAGGKRQREADDQDEPSDGQRAKRQKDETPPRVRDEDDKKMRFKTNYEGFNIYGWILCLLVSRNGDKSRTNTLASEGPSQALVEEWISTHALGHLDEE